MSLAAALTSLLAWSAAGGAATADAVWESIAPPLTRPLRAEDAGVNAANSEAPASAAADRDRRAETAADPDRTPRPADLDGNADLHAHEIAAPPRGGAPGDSARRIRNPKSEPARPPAGSNGAGGWLRSSAALAVVVALIGLLAWGYRALANGVLPLRVRRPGLIEIVSRAALGPRHNLWLVRVGPRMVLVGSTHDRLTALHAIEDAELTAQLAGQAARHAAGSSTQEFRALLEIEETDGHADPGSTPAPPLREPPPDRNAQPQQQPILARLADAQAALRDTLRRYGTDRPASREPTAGAVCDRALRERARATPAAGGREAADPARAFAAASLSRGLDQEPASATAMLRIHNARTDWPSSGGRPCRRAATV